MDRNRAEGGGTAETIAALATPPGTGALAVIRMSGPGAGDALYRCTGRRLKPRRASLVQVRDAEGKLVDEVVATHFIAPASYTGEDVVELSCHGGMLVTQRVLERLLESGARPAEPGEFSRRAFLNGRMDLTQAEAVMDVINAGSDLALRAAQNQLHGAISERVGKAADKLLSLAAHVEAYIDFPDEDIAPDTVARLAERLEGISSSLRVLLATADEGRFLREGVRTAIVGAPNAGKSSLLNALLGYERAIVSDRAGTTRDTIEESVSWGGLRLRLIDTAGLHESADALEQAGMERSRRAWAEADLVLEVADASMPPSSHSAGEAEERQGKGARHVLVLNKSDLPEHPAWKGRDAIRLSCRTGQGMERLESAIARLFRPGQAETDSLVAINTRHRYALQQAIKSLEAARRSLLAGESPELADVDLREALDALGSISGRLDTEDILSRVFSTFCLGK